MLGKLKSGLGAIAVLIVASIAGQMAKEMIRPTQLSLVDSLTQASQKVNSSLPRMIDNVTRLERTAVGPGNRFTYMNTLVNYPGPEQSDLDFKEGIESARMLLTQQVCSKKEMEPMISTGAEIVYSYQDKSGAALFDVVITKDKCTKGMTLEDVRNSLQKLLDKRAEVANQNPPQDDEIVKFESVVVEPGLRLVNNYTLPSHSSTSDGAKIMRGSFKSELLDAQCSDPNTQLDLARGITHVFSYRGNDGENVVTVVISKDTCESTGGDTASNPDEK